MCVYGYLRDGFIPNPDVMAIAGQPDYYNNRKDTITNPQVIVEVLSESTKAYDRGEKFSAYRTIPTFQEYVLIDQTQIYVEQFAKTANKRWTFAEYDEEDEVLVFSSFQVQVPVLDIYDKVAFDVEENRGN